MKRCGKCQELKPLGEFYAMGTRHQAHCKECMKARRRDERRRETLERAAESLQQGPICLSSLMAVWATKPLTVP